jgi:hypothetical protein
MIVKNKRKEKQLPEEEKNATLPYTMRRADSLTVRPLMELARLT